VNELKALGLSVELVGVKKTEDDEKGDEPEEELKKKLVV